MSSPSCGVHGDSDARRDVELVAARLHRALRAPPDALGDDRGVLGVRDLRAGPAELVAAHARELVRVRDRHVAPRDRLAQALAVSFRISSPTLWPSVSLMRLKLSRSMKKTASSRALAAASASAFEMCSRTARRLARPVSESKYASWRMCASARALPPERHRELPHFVGVEGLLEVEQLAPPAGCARRGPRIHVRVGRDDDDVDVRVHRPDRRRRPRAVRSGRHAHVQEGDVEALLLARAGGARRRRGLCAVGRVDLERGSTSALAVLAVEQTVRAAGRPRSGLAPGRSPRISR